MSLLSVIIARLKGEPVAQYRTQAEIDIEQSQLERWHVEQQQERNRRGLARLKLLDAELQVITRRNRDRLAG